MSTKPYWVIPVSILIAIALIAAIWALLDLPSLDRLIPWIGIAGRFETADIIKSILSSVNIGISAILFVVYFRIYRQTGMKISIGLMVFSTAMFFHGLVSDPLIFHRAGRVVGIPVIAEQVFVFAALTSILYISLK